MQTVLVTLLFLLAQNESSMLIPEYHYGHWQMGEQGLTSNYITALAQDSEGYLWIGTLSGLQRFDGYRFVDYAALSLAKDPLPSDKIIELFFDKSGRLWVGTFDQGLILLDFQSGTQLHFQNDPRDDNTLSSDRVPGIGQDSSGKIWVASMLGLNEIDPETYKVKRHYYLSPLDTSGVAESRIETMFVDASDRIFIGTLYDLAEFDPVSGQFHRVPVQTGGIPPANRIKPSHMMQQSSGEMWVTTYGQGLFLLTSRGLEPAPLPLPQNLQLTFLNWTRDDHLWLGGFETGLTLVDPATASVRKPLSSSDDPFSLASRSVRTILEDRNGVLWVGTEETGLYRFQPRTLLLTHLKIAPQNQPPGFQSVTAIASGRTGPVWVGNEDGQIFQLNLETLEKTLVFETQKRGSRIEAMVRDGKGILWASLWREGLLRFDPATESARVFGKGSGSGFLFSDAIYDLILDGDQVLWLATAEGLGRVGSDGTTFHLVLPQGLAENDPVYTLFEDGKGQLWLGTSHGRVHVLDRERHHIQTLQLTEKRSLDQFDFRVMSIGEAPNGEIFVGVLQDGVKRIHPTKFEILSVPGAPETVVSMAVGGEGDLWWGTLEEGLVRFNQETGVSLAFGPEHGAQSQHFSKNASGVYGENHWIFGGRNGLNVFQPDLLDIDRTPPVIIFEKLLIHGAELPDNQARVLTQQGPLRLSHRDDTLTIHFQALQAEQPEKVRFKQMLEPLDRNWTLLNPSQREMTFYNLGPGRYRYLLHAVNGDGVSTLEPKELVFVIPKPPWLSNGALAAYAVLFWLLVWAGFRKRTVRLERQARDLEAQVVLRTQEIKDQKDIIEGLLERQKHLFANISHEFRTPLTLILGPVEQILRQAGKEVNPKLELVRSNALKLLRMVDQILDLTRLSSKQPAPKARLYLNSNLNLLLSAFDAVLQERVLTLEKEFLRDVWIEITPDAFEKIVLNLVSNAIKYTPTGGRIGVRLDQVADKAQLSVSDTGRGIPAADLERIFERFYRQEDHQLQRIPGAGMGLSLVKELTLANSGEIRVASELGVGSTFTVSFPASSQALGQKEDPSPFTPPEEQVQMELNALDVASPVVPETSYGDEFPTATLLIVEDNPAMASYILSELQPTYLCHVAKDGGEGFAMAKELLPDLIVSDVMMPVMTGFALNQAVKAHRETSHIPVILLTAKGDRESFLQGIREGADAYMTKPFDALELKYRIENLLSVRELLKQRYGSRLFEASEGSYALELEEPHGSLDQAFLERFCQLLDESYQDPDFGLKEMVSAMAMSERPLQRKLKALTDLTPSQFLRKFRLKKAAALLAAGQKSSEVAFAVGFSAPSYFTACFKAQFGMPPTEYQIMEPAKSS